MKDSLLFLILNSSVISGIVAFVLTKLLRSKVLVALIALSPYIIAPALQLDDDFEPYEALYRKVLFYGMPGIALGMLYADYKNLLKAIQKFSVTALMARAGILVSSLYLVSYYTHQFIVNHPAIQWLNQFFGFNRRSLNFWDALPANSLTYAWWGLAGALTLLMADKLYSFLQQRHRTEIHGN